MPSWLPAWPLARPFLPTPPEPSPPTDPPTHPPTCNHSLPLPQLRNALEDGHFSLSPSEAEQLMSQIDLDHSGVIGFDDWVAAMADWRQVRGRGRGGGCGC